MQAIIAATGAATHNPSDRSRCVHRSGKDAATTLSMSAPSAAVAVHPYQCIAGRKLPIDGATVSREVRAQKHDANRWIDGEQCEIEFERNHVEHREGKPIHKGEPAEPGR